jgi:hypothetical protein
MQYTKNDGTVRVLRAPMREIAAAWISDNRTAAILARQTSQVAARHAADRRRYIAERARLLAGTAAAHRRLSLIEQQLRCELEARLEQLGLELQLRCAGAEQLDTESAGPALRKLSWQMLLATLLAGQVREFLDGHESAPETAITVERLHALEQHADTLAEAVERLMIAGD